MRTKPSSSGSRFLWFAGLATGIAATGIYAFTVKHGQPSPQTPAGETAPVPPVANEAPPVVAARADDESAREHRSDAAPGGGGQEVRELVDSLRGKKAVFLMTRKERKAHPGDFPKDLLEQVGKLESKEFLQALSTLGNDAGLEKKARSALAGEMCGAWLENPEHQNDRSLRIVLDALYQLVPVLSPDDRVSSFQPAVGQSTPWGAKPWTDFLVDHWDDWPDPQDPTGNVLLRAMVQGSITDPEQLSRLKALPFKEDWAPQGH